MLFIARDLWSLVTSIVLIERDDIYDGLDHRFFFFYWVASFCELSASGHVASWFTYSKVNSVTSRRGKGRAQGSEISSYRILSTFREAFRYVTPLQVLEDQSCSIVEGNFSKAMVSPKIFGTKFIIWVKFHPKIDEVLSYFHHEGKFEDQLTSQNLITTDFEIMYSGNWHISRSQETRLLMKLISIIVFISQDFERNFRSLAF